MLSYQFVKFWLREKKSWNNESQTIILFKPNPMLTLKKMFSSNNNVFYFKTWWATWIHTMLEIERKNNTSPDDHSYFPKCLFDVLLKMWRCNPYVKQGVKIFIGKTNDLEGFENNVYKYPRKIRKMINKHCRPVTQCPLGC